MPSDRFTTPANTLDAMRALAKRVDILEKAYKPDRTYRIGVPYVFHFPSDSALTVSTSDALPTALSGSIRVWAANLSTPGSTDTTVVLLIDGSSVATVTIPAGEASNFVRFVAPVTFGKALQADLTAVGTGAAGLVCVALQVANTL